MVVLFAKALISTVVSIAISWGYGEDTPLVPLSHSCKLFLTDNPHLANIYNEPSTAPPFAIRTEWEYLSQVPIAISQRERELWSCRDRRSVKQEKWEGETVIFDPVCRLNDPNASSFLYPILSPWNQQITSLEKLVKGYDVFQAMESQKWCDRAPRSTWCLYLCALPCCENILQQGHHGMWRGDGTKPPTLPSWRHLRQAPSDEFPSLVSERSQ